MLTHPQLMAQIARYAIDDPQNPNPAFGFVDRLCVETGWSKPFARGAIAEYRRFVYLAVTGERPVTPSREVDAVWHLHLTYTRSYWQRLTPLLPRALHHEPTPGGAAAAATYRAQYADTMARYLAEFGEAPPADYWPPESERFQRDMRKMRGRQRFLRIPAWPWIAAAAAAGSMPAFAAVELTSMSITALVVVAGVVAIFLAVMAWGGGGGPSGDREKDRRGDGGGGFVSSDGGSTSGGKGGKGDGGESGGGDGGGCGGGGCGGG